jgi:hypothetical protein
MNQESTDFAAYRFTPRQSRSPDHSCAVEHYAPPSPPRWHVWAWLCVAGAVTIGAVLALGG